MKIVLVVMLCFYLSGWSQEIDSVGLMRVQMLEEVSLENLQIKKKNYILGTYKENTRLLGLSYGFKTNCYNEVAVYIPNDNKRSIIESILINIRDLDKDSLYNISLYTVDTSKMYDAPNKVIFSYTAMGDVIKKNPIDISALKLKIPENGIFVAFRGWDFSYKTTDNVPEKRTVTQIEGGIFRNSWVYLKGYKKTENARFGLLMEEK